MKKKRARRASKSASNRRRKPASIHIHREQRGNLESTVMLRSNEPEETPDGGLSCTVDIGAFVQQVMFDEFKRSGLLTEDGKKSPRLIEWEREQRKKLRDERRRRMEGR